VKNGKRKEAHDRANNEQTGKGERQNAEDNSINKYKNIEKTTTNAKRRKTKQY
jgi:hypothetical protein